MYGQRVEAVRQPVVQATQGDTVLIYIASGKKVHTSVQRFTSLASIYSLAPLTSVERYITGMNT